MNGCPLPTAWSTVAPCGVERDELVRVCNERTGQRQVIEQRRAEPQVPPKSRYTCEPR